MGMLQLRTYRYRQESTGSLPCMQTCQELFPNQGRELLVVCNHLITSYINEIGVAVFATLISFICMCCNRLCSTFFKKRRSYVQNDVVYECQQHYQRPIGSGHNRSYDYADDAGYEATPEHFGCLVGLKSFSEFHGEHRYFADQQC